MKCVIMNQYPLNSSTCFSIIFEVLGFTLQGVPGIVSYLLRLITTKSSGSSWVGLHAEVLVGHVFSMEGDRLMYLQPGGCGVSWSSYTYSYTIYNISCGSSIHNARNVRGYVRLPYATCKLNMVNHNNHEDK